MMLLCLKRLLLASLVFLLAPGLYAQTPDKPIFVQIDVWLKDVPPDIAKLSQTKPSTDEAGQPLATLNPEAADQILKTARAHKQTKVASHTVVRTLSGQACRFHTGGQVAMPSMVDGKGKVEMRDVGLIVEMMPTVNDKGEIQIRVSIESSSVNKKGIETGVGRMPIMNIRNTETTIGAHAGQTLAIWPDGQTRRKDGLATLVLMTPTIIPSGGNGTEEQAAPAPTVVPKMNSADRLRNVAQQLVAEYQLAAAAGDKELAAKLARMALELDPLAFRAAPATTRE